MTAKIIKRPIVHLDIVDQAIFIADDNPHAAERFLDAVEKAFKLLAIMPEMGSPRRFREKALDGIRMWPVKGFERHLIFFGRGQQASKLFASFMQHGTSIMFSNKMSNKADYVAESQSDDFLFQTVVRAMPFAQEISVFKPIFP